MRRSDQRAHSLLPDSLCADLQMFQITDLIVRTLRLLITHWLNCQMTINSDCLTNCFSSNWISSPPLQLPQQLSGIKSPSLWSQQQDERYDWQAAIWKQVRRVHLPPNWLFIIKALLEVWLLTSLLPPLQSAAVSLLTIKKHRDRSEYFCCSLVSRHWCWRQQDTLTGILVLRAEFGRRAHRLPQYLMV